MEPDLLPDAVAAATSAAGAAQAAVQAAPPAALTSAPDALSAATAAAAHVSWFNAVEYAVMVPLVYLAAAFFIVMAVVRIISIFRAPAHGHGGPKTGAAMEGRAPVPLYNNALYPASRHPVVSALRDAFAMPQVRRHKPVFWVFLMAFHASLLLLILGHLDILPQINILSPASRHMLGAGAVGAILTASVVYFIFRRFRSPVRELSAPADFLLLFLILFLFLLGDLMSWGNSWTASGFVMTKQDFSAYFDSLLRFTFADPRRMLPGSHYHFAVLHVLFADAFFIVAPFSRIMHAFFAVPVNLLRRIPWKNR